MTIFYLHLFNRLGAILDEEGRDLPDLAAAREEAIRNARSIMAEEVRAGELDLNARIDIAGPRADQVHFTLPFSDALVIRMAGER